MCLDSPPVAMDTTDDHLLEIAAISSRETHRQIESTVQVNQARFKRVSSNLSITSQELRDLISDSLDEEASSAPPCVQPPQSNSLPHSFRRMSSGPPELRDLIHDSLDDRASSGHAQPPHNSFRRMPSGNSYALLPCPLVATQQATTTESESGGCPEMTRVSSFAMLSMGDMQELESLPPRNEEVETGAVKQRLEWDTGLLEEHVAHSRIAEALGPFGPYNPPPAYMREIRQQDPQCGPVRDRAIDPYEGQQVIMVSGKHKGKRAFVQRRVNKKYRVQVEGVPYGLEFFPRAFALQTSL